MDAPPHGFLDDQQQPEGYDIDVANLLANALGVKANIVPVTGPNRIPHLLTSKMDVVIATMGITPERARQVLYTVPYGTVSAYILAAKDKNMTSAVGAAMRSSAVHQPLVLRLMRWPEAHRPETEPNLAGRPDLHSYW